ncbi:hypothetical protein BKK49_06175 [Rodentibacter rarus]|uniref:DUF805 domain-containing protein n=1 Tax=Rodentibacter rarus TaxID=1908260 RepID=A0A1V3IQ51_9PAST|nr:DUF805 domain-containing protein [Rodentibacter rarus]OOF40408.1 hypothetical protein BKK49_06175 [Rodentibacter rarus]OOF44385.1 hypothetical protein BKK50_02925 [Rodentibacter rarus]
MNWYLSVLKNYATFNGRARRKEYWMFALFNTVITIALVIFDELLGLVNYEVGFGILSGLYSLAVIIPGLAVSIRRLHDVNRSGWWVLIALIPFGCIVLFIFGCLDSQPGDNQYGPNPKE